MSQIFTAGSVVDPNRWVFVFPTGSGGLSHFIQPTTISAFTSAGLFVVGAHFPGADGGEEDYGFRYREISLLVDQVQSTYGLTARPSLYCQSRGGLQGLNFACDNPTKVTRIACLYPVTNPVVYPGRGVPLILAHSKTDEEFDAVMASGKTILRAFTPNAKSTTLSSIPVCMWHGDIDSVVPKSLTTDVFARFCGAHVKTISNFGHETVPNNIRDEIVAFVNAGTVPSGAVKQSA